MIGDEVAFYRTPTGRVMVLCECRCKVRLLASGALANHIAYDGSMAYGADRPSRAAYCRNSGLVLEIRDGDVYGLEWGVLRAPETTA